MTEGKRLRVLLTNDDGPPGTDSPYIFGFAQHLVNDLGWDVQVVIPSSQKSWIGKAFQIKEIINGCYYYPRNTGGIGEVSPRPRPLKTDDGEVGEWVLLDGTPATCTNIALHNLYPGEIDVVISGPNLGRNSSAAFALSSGTIGAALSGAVSGFRAFAVSYGTVARPVPPELYEPAHKLACRIISRLWEDWPTLSSTSEESSNVPDLYNINIPMVDALIREPDGMRVVWTFMWRSSYQQLFSLHHSIPEKRIEDEGADVPQGGPDAAQATSSDHSGATEDTDNTIDVHCSKPLSFKFAPTRSFQNLINPPLESLPVGSDGWAIAHNWASVTPLNASFAEPKLPFSIDIDTADGARLLKL